MKWHHESYRDCRITQPSRWYETFSDWQQKYGDMIYMEALGNRFIILNSLDIANELLIKRGNIHSGRPMDTMNYTV